MKVVNEVIARYVGLFSFHYECPVDGLTVTNDDEHLIVGVIARYVGLFSFHD